MRFTVINLIHQDARVLSDFILISLNINLFLNIETI